MELHEKWREEEYFLGSSSGGARTHLALDKGCARDSRRAIARGQYSDRDSGSRWHTSPVREASGVIPLALATSFGVAHPPRHPPRSASLVPAQRTPPARCQRATLSCRRSLTLCAIGMGASRQHSDDRPKFQRTTTNKSVSILPKPYSALFSREIRGIAESALRQIRQFLWQAAAQGGNSV